MTKLAKMERCWKLELLTDRVTDKGKLVAEKIDHIATKSSVSRRKSAILLQKYPDLQSSLGSQDPLGCIECCKQ